MLMALQNEVEKLAQNLDTWAKEKLPPKQQALLQWLLSRVESQEVKIGKGSHATKINIDETNIKKAAMDAFAALNPEPLSTSSGTHSGYVWPRSGYVWPRSGYVWPRS
jgi:hypothetical protein